MVGYAVDTHCMHSVSLEPLERCSLTWLLLQGDEKFRHPAAPGAPTDSLDTDYPLGSRVPQSRSY